MMMEFKIWTHFARAFQNYILSCSCWCSVIQRFSVNNKDCVDDILHLFLCKWQFWELWWESEEHLRKDLFGCSVANVCVSVEAFCTSCLTTVLVFPTRNFYLKLRHPLALSAYHWNPQVTGWWLVIPWGKQPEKAEESLLRDINQTRETISEVPMGGREAWTRQWGHLLCYGDLQRKIETNEERGKNMDP